MVEEVIVSFHHGWGLMRSPRCRRRPIPYTSHPLMERELATESVFIETNRPALTAELLEAKRPVTVLDLVGLLRLHLEQEVLEDATIQTWLPVKKEQTPVSTELWCDGHKLFACVPVALTRGKDKLAARLAEIVHPEKGSVMVCRTHTPPTHGERRRRLSSRRCPVRRSREAGRSMFGR